ncbi:hypothetical protein FGO68_gene15202 [Halteria grandinella]|uniref:Protein kinase domain-containing protein n=1 Tax=Halteria grandinella TaxID=5974 RepID=A0A8J8T353_HALGN|nr:hypothetical protein FGO68_gene15202 [Halteria grandinella]
MVEIAVKKTMLNQQRRRRLEVFKRELRALSRIPKHPGIVQILGFGKDPMDEFVFILLEKCNGGSGWDWVQNVFSTFTTFPLDILLSLSILAEGCSLMSTSGILHRDLTLDNILIHTITSTDAKSPHEPQFLMKLCDFGVSGTPADFKEVPRGKMRNYAPEAIGEGSDRYEYTEGSDVYMFGTMLWEMIHNKLIWSECNTMTANKRVVGGEVAQVDETVRERVPQGLIEVMYECMRYQAEERPTFKEVSEKLRTLHQTLTQA